MARHSIVHNDLGYIFNFPLRIAGFVLVLVGLVVFATQGWGLLIGLLLMVAGLFFALTKHGISVNKPQKAVRKYKSYGGLKNGHWIEYSTYNGVAIIRKEKKSKQFFASPGENSDSPYRFEICLLSRSHRGKVLLEIAYSREDAAQLAKEYAHEMDAVVVEYSPPGRTKTNRKGQKEGHGEEAENKRKNHGIDNLDEDLDD